MPSTLALRAGAGAPPTRPARKPVSLGAEALDFIWFRRIDAFVPAALALRITLGCLARRDRDRFERLLAAASLRVR
ncbi:MAG: hypothetical protein M3380_02860 [Chloroflexota bacterium]|nr:hypothetical protein [Chloroflexota bacterium]